MLNGGNGKINIGHMGQNVKQSEIGWGNRHGGHNVFCLLRPFSPKKYPFIVIFVHFCPFLPFFVRPGETKKDNATSGWGFYCLPSPF